MIKAEADYGPASPKFDELAGGGAVSATYWGLAKAPGMGGIHLERRKPNQTAPALEADTHRVLVR